MIKSCKWCGKKQQMIGRQKFCPGRKCRNAWVYRKKTGQLKRATIGEIPDDVMAKINKAIFFGIYKI